MRISQTVLATTAMLVATVQAHAVPCGTIVGDATDNSAETITTDTTWGGGANPSPICLEEPVFVGEGSTATATTLTILEGTVVRGQPRRGAVGTINNNAGSLIVTRFSSIEASGTATAPIIMTTAAVDNNGDGVCDDGNGDDFIDPHPGFQDIGGCIDAGSCTTAESPANAVFCDASPQTSALAPLDADGGDNVRLWGGFALNGNAPTNLAGNSAGNLELGEGVLEGVVLPNTPQAYAEFGGPEPHDSSGTIRYVSVRHAGDELVVNQELNGVSLAGVGDGTVYEFVEVYANFDDGHEWFGGTVNGNHLVTVYAGDDQFDLDQGFTGNLQFLLAIMPFFDQENLAADPYGSGSGDAVGEFDGTDGVGDVRVGRDLADADESDQPLPFPDVGVWNLTAIGSTTDGANPAFNPTSANRGIRMRNGFGGGVFNSIIVNTSLPCVDPDNDAAADAPAGWLTQDNVAAGLVRLRNTTCQDAPSGDAPSDPSNTVDAGPTLVEEDPNHTGSAGLGNASTGVLPTASMSETNGYDPRPIASEAGETPQEKSLDRSATYRGAFEAGADELWTTNWTAAEVSNILSQ